MVITSIKRRIHAVIERLKSSCSFHVNRRRDSFIIQEVHKRLAAPDYMTLHKVARNWQKIGELWQFAKPTPPKFFTVWYMQNCASDFISSICHSTAASMSQAHQYTTLVQPMLLLVKEYIRCHPSNRTI